MGHVQVAAGDDGLMLIQLRQVVSEGFVPLETMVDPGQSRLGVGGVAGHKVKCRVFQCDQPPFRVQLRDADAVGDRQRLLPGENCRTGVALFLGVIPELRIAGQGKVNLAFL